MWSPFKRRGAPPSLIPGATIDSLRFDTAGLTEKRNFATPTDRVWWSAEGDGVGATFIPKPPDLPANARSLADLAAIYRKLMEPGGIQLVECDLVTLATVRAVKLIVAAPQPPTGRTCVGSLTIPFRDFSFVIKCQCAEQPPTGMKEAILVDRHLDAGGDPDALPNVNDPKHDAEFPNHPVARARRLLRHITSSLRLDPAAASQPVFPLPTR